MAKKPVLPRWDGEMRPIPITVICWLGILFNLIWLLMAFLTTPAHKQQLYALGVLLGPISVLESLLAMLAFWGVYRMKIWGLTLYLIIVIAFSLYSYFLANTNIYNLALDGLIAIIFLCYIRQMD